MNEVIMPEHGSKPLCLLLLYQMCFFESYRMSIFILRILLTRYSSRFEDFLKSGLDRIQISASAVNASDASFPNIRLSNMDRNI